MNRSLASIWKLAALAALGIAGCGERNAYQEPPPPLVTSQLPIERPVEDWLVFTGVTQAQKTVELRSRVRGYLKEIHFTDGDIVEQDELLFIIDPEPFEAERDAAQASLDKAKAALGLAQTNLTRTTRLSNNNAISEQQLDIDRAELATAEANIKTAEANLKQANLNLGYTEIRAPMSGMIGRHLVDRGNLVLPDQTLLAVIESTAPIHAYFNVSERDLLRAETLQVSVPTPNGTEAQQPVSASTEADSAAPDRSASTKSDNFPVAMALGDSGEFEFQGTLDFRELGIDPETGTTMRRAEFQNADGRLVPGMFVRVRVSLGPPRSRLLVKQQALGADQLGDFVLVVGKDKKVERRKVTLGPSVGDLRVVDGIKPGESIIVEGLQRARPGSVVNDQPPVAAAASPQNAVPHGEGVTAVSGKATAEGE